MTLGNMNDMENCILCAFISTFCVGQEWNLYLYQQCLAGEIIGLTDDWGQVWYELAHLFQKKRFM